MKFIKYQHLERFGTSETEGIEFGEAYVFPKIDGSNGCIWLSDGEIQAGSRRNHLSLEKDNAGFYAWVLHQDNIIAYLKENPTHRLYGEWLVPHSLKTYKETAWRNFYVFDVAVDKLAEEIRHEGDSEVIYQHYEFYKPLLEKHNIPYIHPIAILRNGSYDQFIKQLGNNVFLIEDGKGCGEGLVIKNYEWRNKYGRQTWAKIVTSEFKEKHAKEMGAPVVKGKALVEEAIAKSYVTSALIEKEMAKIALEDGWSSRHIPRLLNTVFYCVIKEDAWDFVKEHKNPTINFKTLQHFVVTEIKAKKPEVFA
jgi:hypothetical protein